MSFRYPPTKPEVMSPAGYWPQLNAAIEAGADAVYFGLKHFTARAKAGFALSELPEVFRTLHARGVRGFVTFNTLVFDHELDEAGRALCAIVEAGADALIVQDLGIARLARQMAPEIEIHGSTQMSVTSAEGVNFAERLGVNRVTLARELSLDEIRAIRAGTSCELEIFVHGALCVAYSGQCFSSEAWGGRSANRGQCAQACRLPYEMLVDGVVRPLGDSRYLLSPGDLYALRYIPEILQIGISALKIEGRYKDADYVALTTRAYRKAVDEAWAGLPLGVTPSSEAELEQVYSRGLAPHFLSGTNHQSVVRGRAPRHRGVLLGRVTHVLPGAVVIGADDHAHPAPKPGDGVVFDAADWRSPEEPEEGGRVFEVRTERDGAVELRFANGAVNFSRIRTGDLLWRTHDPDLDKAIRPFLDPASPVTRQPVRVKVTAQEGEPLRTRWWLVNQPRVSVAVESSSILGPARQRALDSEFLREQLGRLGNTAYRLEDLEFEVTGRPFAPASVLNQLRRDAVERLAALQREPRDVVVQPVTIAAPRPEPAAADLTLALHLLVRTPEQLDAALALAPASITLDYLDLYGLKPSADRVKSSGIEVRIASPRILKPGEMRVADFLLRLDCPILVRPVGLIEMLRLRPHPPLTGDFSLNAANHLSARLCLDLGLDRITPAYDLNAAQVAALARETGGHRMEVVVYHHLPVFHTEHCVFCRFLSTGTTYKDCGRPCESHRVALRDVSGRAHPVMADTGCRNTIFGAEAQQASVYIDEWLAAGIRHLRLEFAHETAEQVTAVTRAFADRLAGRKSSDRLNQELKQLAPQGTTEGSYFVAKDYRQLPILQ